MSNIIRYDDENEIEVLTRGRGHLAGRSGLEFIRYLDREAAQVAEKALFEQSALEALAPAVREMAAGAAATVLSEMREGATYAEVDFDVKASSDHWTFFGFSGEGHNVRVAGGMRARSNKPR
jgi:predicted nicotinamide N-methyase